MKSLNYVIEHMEEDDSATKALPEWVKLEYSHMLNLIGPSSHLHFTSLSSTSIPPLQNYLSSSSSPSSSSSSASSDPGPSSKAKLHTMPILSLLDTLHSNPSRVCLLDPRATQVISPSDGETFDFFLYGGILGDDPPRDRTGELRKLGFEGRHLGPVQMTTDTAVGVTKRVVEDKVPLDEIPFIDFPTITFNEHESIEMPFRYIKDAEGQPILPPGMKEHLKADLDRTIDDF